MRTSKKSAIAIITTLFVVMGVLLSACGATNSNTSNTGRAPADKQNLMLPLEGIADLGTFDPALVTTSTSSDAVSMVFTGLVSLNAQEQIIPELASSWTTSSDGLTWTFTLKPNLKFSDGTSLTSANVIYSINRALTPALASPVAPSYLNLVQDSDKMAAGKIKTLIGDSLLDPNPNTVVIKINKPASYFLGTLTYPTAYVVEQSLVDKYGNAQFTNHLNEGGGTGPYKVKSYTHGKNIVLVPNSNYVGKVPTVNVTWTFYKDTTTTFEAEQNGQVDRASVPTANLSQVQNTPEFIKEPTLAIFYYGMNFLDKPFNNIDIRQAFDLAINKNEVTSVVYKNVYTPTNHIVPEGMPGYDANLKGPDGTTSTSGNTTLAKKLFAEGLQQEGYTSASQLPKIQFPYDSGNPDLTKEITIVVQDWKSILGVTIQPVPTDFETLSAQIEKNNGQTTDALFQTGWIADYPDAQDWTTLQFAPDQANNQTNYGQNKSSNAASQVQVQKELASADVEKNATQRLAMYNDAEQKLINDVTWLPMYQETIAYVLQSYVKGFTFDPNDIIPPSDWYKVYITNH